MHTSTLTSLLALSLISLTTAMSLVSRTGIPPTITLRLQTSYGLSPNHTYSAVTIPLNAFASIFCSPAPGVPQDGCALSKMEIVATGNVGALPLEQFECRGYKDVDGLQPGSAKFTVKQPALVSTNLGVERSVLCYVRTVGEVEDEAVVEK